MKQNQRENDRLRPHRWTDWKRLPRSVKQNLCLPDGEPNLGALRSGHSANGLCRFSWKSFFCVSK